MRPNRWTNMECCSQNRETGLWSAICGHMAYRLPRIDCLLFPVTTNQAIADRATGGLGGLATDMWHLPMPGVEKGLPPFVLHP